MTFRALPGGLRKPIVREYRVPHPKEAIESPGYFLTLANHFAKQDRILVMAENPDGSWEEATFVVLHSDRRCVLVERIDEWQHRGLKVSGEVKAVPNGSGRFDVVEVATGRTIAPRVEQSVAQMLVARNRSEEPQSIDDMTGPQLQQALKAATGHGFKPGTPLDEVRAQLRAAMEREAA